MKPPGTRAASIEVAVGLFVVEVGLRRRHFTIANGSLHETVAAVDLAVAIGAVKPEDASAIQALAVRFKAMLRALICRAQ